MNAPRVGATANPPKSDDRYDQLTRGAFMINDSLQNPHFNKPKLIKSDCHTQRIGQSNLKDLKVAWEICLSILLWPDLTSQIREQMSGAEIS